VQVELSSHERCDESSRMHVALALEEALTNALYHGNLELSSLLRERDDAGYYVLAKRRRRQWPYCNRRIRVELTVLDDRAVIAVRDEGRGFDPAALPDPCDPENIGRVCGRGVLLMRSVMDQVTFSKRGNKVRMVKRWKPPVLRIE
jgi:anti-sigma regulatory factor (Ser/Thr protein kinase)